MASRIPLLALLLMVALVLPSVPIAARKKSCPSTLEVCSAVNKAADKCYLGPGAQVMTDHTAEIKEELKESREEKANLDNQLQECRQENQKLEAEVKSLKVDECSEGTDNCHTQAICKPGYQGDGLTCTKVCKAPNFQVGSQCFFLSGDKKSWDSAVSACRALGGALAEPANVGQFIARVRGKTQEEVYLGVNDRAREGHWVGLSGRPFNGGGHWDKNEPNSDRGDEDCLEIQQKKHGLNDIRCSHKVRYVCEV